MTNAKHELRKMYRDSIWRFSLEHKLIFNTHIFQTLPLDLGEGEGASTLCDVSFNAEGNASGTVDN